MAAVTERGFLRQAWDIAWPYWKSEEKWSAIGLLGAVVALNLITVWLNVRFNYWNNNFYNALQQYDWGACAGIYGGRRLRRLSAADTAHSVATVVDGALLARLAR